MRKLVYIRMSKRYDDYGNEITEFNKDMTLQEREYYGREFDESR